MGPLFLSQNRTNVMNLSTFCASRHVKYYRNRQNEPPRGSFWSSLGASLRALGASWKALGCVLGALRELLRTSSAWENLYFQKWAPRLDGSTIFETCTSKNGKRVTEGAYSFVWDKERAGEGVREDETRSQRTK